VVIAGKGTYESSINLTNLAYDVALAVREAQVFGLNARAQESGGGCSVSPDNSSRCFEISYGVRFRKTPYSNEFDSSSVSVILFADRNNDRYYNPPVDSSDNLRDKKIREYRISGTNVVGEICYKQKAYSGCNTSLPYGMLDITFRRPDTDACINLGYSLDDGEAQLGLEKSYKCADSTFPTLGMEYAKITLRALDGKTRDVYVYSSGQIAVK
jgi:hypothetical protein